MKLKEIQLLPHNEEAFIKLKKCLQDNKLVAINHATGTGKSFIVLKYLYENRDKRILFLSPSYPINDQLLQEHTKELGIDLAEFKKFDSMIYRTLLKMDMDELASNYDIIILDEYHRCGAKEWGIRINELLACIKEKYPQIKVIGTTATEIRYLDNERNMNNILFDGVCASTLTLVDAMLREILPVPIYINSLFELSDEYEKMVKKVYKKSFYGIEREYYLKLIEGTREEIDKIINDEEDIQQYIKRDGKHLVFSSTIDNIARDKLIINKILNSYHKEYEVHSKKSKQENERALREFRYDDNPATLYCVNILNEGVHVKGVDSIFMLRPTSSPIIFFQQLGRLLSYSRRKDRVVVFDLVNNIKRSPYIYQLYIDLCKRANELIELDPDNKERYLRIVKAFKIVDATSKIYKKLDILKEALRKDNFYKERIDFVISILSGEVQTNKVEENMARIDLFKYYKYITIEQYRKIKKLNVNKPSIFNLSEEEFIKMLCGEENINQKEKRNDVIIINQVNNFYNINGYFPSILGTSPDEILIARNFIDIYDGEEIGENLFENKNIDNLTEYEKIVYGIAKNIDIDLLYSEIDRMIERNIDIYPTILNVIQKQNTKISRLYIDKILKYNSKHTCNIRNFKEEMAGDINLGDELDLRVLYSKDYERIAKECMIELQKYDSLDEYLRLIADDISLYIRKTRRMPVYYLSGLSEKDAEEMRTLYVKKMIFYHELKSFGYIDELDEVYNLVQIELARMNKNQILVKLKEFLQTHNGDMPSLSIESDRQLALKVNRIMPILDDDDIEELNLYKKSNRIREVVIHYVAFVKKHKRYPLITTTDEEEKELLDDYIRNEPYFGEVEKKMIHNLKKEITSREAMQNAYTELLKQKKRR